MSSTLPIPNNALLSTPREEQRRVRITTGGSDCATIPKVPHAGEVFAGPEGEYQLMHNGLRVVKDGYQGAWMTEVIRLLRGHHEPQEERVFHEILRNVHAGAAMLELGSYWAYYSLWFGKQIPGARLYLIEPDPNNLEVGSQNFALNGMRGRFFQYAIGAASAPAGQMRCETGEFMVPVISVDDFVAAQGLASIDVLLADIQGSELQMLEGATRSIDRGVVRFVLVSTHHHAISQDPLTHQKCLHFVTERGGHVLAEHTVSESYSGDGLIVASFRAEDSHLAPIAVSRNYPSNSLFRALEYDLADAWREAASTRQELEAQIEAARLERDALERALESARQELESTREAVWPHFSASPARLLLRRARRIWQMLGVLAAP